MGAGNIEVRETSVKIIIATESPQIAGIVTSKLERDGFQVFWKPNAHQCLEFIDQEGARLAILDSVLPDMESGALVKEIRQRQSSEMLPIFVLLDRLQERTAEDFLSSGANAVIAKPFRPTDLSKKIRKILWRETANV